MRHSYDQTFMDYTDRSSRYAAGVITGLLRNALPIESVLDVGCARGTWLAAWREAGIPDIAGVDGDYIDTSTLQIPIENFTAADLSTPIDLGRRFHLVQSLEVAEHVRADASDQFVDNLVRHSDGIILFSAAPPGQGGEFHVNEQPFEYWRDKFATRGYIACDFLRPQIANDHGISFWYRYNTLLYVSADRLLSLSQAISASIVSDQSPIPDISPFLFRLRKLFVRCLPEAMRNWIARLKSRRSSN